MTKRIIRNYVSKSISIKLTTLEAIKAIAEKRGVSFSEIVGEAIDLYLTKMEKRK